MNQDIILVICSFCCCLFFVLCHCLLAHMYSSQSSPVVFVKTLFVSWIVTNSIVISVVYLQHVPTLFFGSLFFLMNLWIAVYCLGIALIMYASIHVKVFRIISKKQHTSMCDFLAYTDYQIVAAHVDSLIESNVLKKHKNDYEIGHSYLIKTYTFLSDVTETLFPVKQV